MSKYNLTDIFEQYRIGSGYTRDFDYEGMLKAGLETGVDTDIKLLKYMVEDYTDVNYHREASHLYKAIEALEDGQPIDEISMLFGDFHAEIRDTMKTFDMGIPDTLGGFMDSYIKEDTKAVDLAIEASQEKAGINEDKDKEPRDGVKSAAAKLGIKPKHVKEVSSSVGSRIEGLLNIPMKQKFLDAGMDLIQDLLEEDPFFIPDVIDHLSIELEKYYDGFLDQGDRLALGLDDFEQEEFTAINEEESNIPFSQRVGPEYTLDSIAQDEFFGKNYDELDPQQQKYVRSELEITKGYPFSAGIDQDGARLPEFPDPMKNMKEDKGVDFIRALKVDANGTSLEIKSYLESLKRSGDKFDSVDDYVEDFKNYIADKALQEHFKRFM